VLVLLNKVRWRCWTRYKRKCQLCMYKCRLNSCQTRLLLEYCLCLDNATKTCIHLCVFSK
jgi:hypothetical protein